MDDAYKREAYWACCPWCDEEKCIDHNTCKAVKEFAEQLRNESKEAQSIFRCLMTSMVTNDQSSLWSGKNAAIVRDCTTAMVDS